MHFLMVFLKKLFIWPNLKGLLTHVCKLNRALYGLKQAPRSWYERLKSAMLSWGFTNSGADNSLLFLVTNTVKVYVRSG